MQGKFTWRLKLYLINKIHSKVKSRYQPYIMAWVVDEEKSVNGYHGFRYEDLFSVECLHGTSSTRDCKLPQTNGRRIHPTFPPSL